jgi:hypothetical protein
MTSQGSLYGQFQRALRRRDLLAVRGLAGELPRLSLGDALAVLLLIRDVEPARYERAALRWHARVVEERPALGLRDAARLLAALADLAPPSPSALEALRGVCEEQGVAVDAALRA